MGQSVIPFPDRILCINCAHWVLTKESVGFCVMWNEPVGDEHIAKICPDFEREDNR